MREWLMVAAMFVVSVGLAACAGGKAAGTSSGSASSAASAVTSTAATASAPSTFAGQVEAICARRNRALVAGGEQITSQNTFEDIAGRRAAAEQTALDELRKLAAPASLEPAWHEFMSSTQALGKAWATLSRRGIAYRRGAEFGGAEVVRRKLLVAARHLGFKECTQVD